MPLIALTTDFGTTDPFVGIMKGVMAGIAPGVPTVDITHAIPPGDVQRGAIVLWQAAPYFPAGTVFLAVVDPGVGTSRRGIILHAQGQVFVGPDNGLFSYILAGEGDTRAWEIANPRHASSTFHGRDVFAPAAARAALGVGDATGAECPNLVRLPSPKLELVSPGELRGEIVTVDQFGNTLTSLGRFIPTANGKIKLSPWLGQSLPVVKFSPGQARVTLPSGQTIPLADTFAHIPPGKCAALIGSTGLLEIAANRQSAAEILGLKRGMAVSIQYPISNI